MSALQSATQVSIAGRLAAATDAAEISHASSSTQTSGSNPGQQVVSSGSPVPAVQSSHDSLPVAESADGCLLEDCPQEVRLLSLMTSVCKACLVGSIELLEGITIPLHRSEACAAAATATAATMVLRLCCQQPQSSQQPLLQPAVRPWLLLLGRCMVIMGQRLRMLQSDHSWRCTHFFEDEESRLQRQLNALQQQLGQSQSADATRLMQRSWQLDQSAQDRQQAITAIHRMLAAGSDPEVPSEVMLARLQECTDRLRCVRRDKESVLAQLQTVGEQQQLLCQQIGQTDVEMQLCGQLNYHYPAEVLSDLHSLVSALISVQLQLRRSCRGNQTSANVRLPQQQPQSRSHRSTNQRDVGSGSVYTVLPPLNKLLPTMLVIEDHCHLLARPADRCGQVVLDPTDAAQPVVVLLNGHFEAAVQINGKSDVATGQWGQ